MSAKIKLNLILNSFDLDKSWLKLKSTVFFANNVAASRIDSIYEISFLRASISSSVKRKENRKRACPNSSFSSQTCQVCGNF